MLNDNKFTVYFHIKLNSEKNKWFSNKRKKKIMFENIRKPSAELAEGYLNPVTKHL